MLHIMSHTEIRCDPMSCTESRHLLLDTWYLVCSPRYLTDLVREVRDALCFVEKCSMPRTENRQQVLGYALLEGHVRKSVMLFVKRKPVTLNVKHRRKPVVLVRAM